ncbi:MAG: SemiSWEET family transporter [Thermoleophilia bacterium]
MSRVPEMGMNSTTLLGLAAGGLTTACWIPQLRRSIRTRSTGDLSWGYLLVLGLGVLLWFLYGVVLHDPAIILTNGLTLMALLVLAEVKRRHASPAPRGDA